MLGYFVNDVVRRETMANASVSGFRLGLSRVVLKLFRFHASCLYGFDMRMRDIYGFREARLGVASSWAGENVSIKCFEVACCGVCPGLVGVGAWKVERTHAMRLGGKRHCYQLNLLSLW